MPAHVVGSLIAACRSEDSDLGVAPLAMPLAAASEAELIAAIGGCGPDVGFKVRWKHFCHA